MLVDLNAEIYGLRLDVLGFENLAGPEYLIHKAELDSKLKQRIWMVLGEGAVFMVILIAGFWSVRKGIVKELKLADQQKNFLLSITHELKSPLAAIKLQLQTLHSRNLPEDKRKELYQRALGDSDRLEKLVENLLLVNKVESGRLPVTRSKLDLSVLINALLNSHYAEEFRSGSVQFESDVEATIEGDSLALQSVILNLIDNALKYGNESIVSVSIQRENNSILFCVADQGPGIPDMEKKKVFERFYRIGNEKVRKTKGTGIGLYLVKLLVEQHEANIRIEDNKPSGVVFTVTFPVA